MENLSAEQKLRKMAESVVHYTHNLISSDIQDPESREAFRVLRNCVDVIAGTAIPEIREEIVRTSKTLGEIHLIHNNLTPAQRALLESWVFKNHE